MTEPLIIAHLSDCHLDARPITVARLRQVVAAVRELPRLDAVVVTGDVADNGAAEEYQAFLAEIAGLPPMIVTTGNHCIRAVFEANIGPRNRLLDVGSLRIVALDTAMDGKDEGRLDEATLAFAREAIGRAPGAVLLACHHPAVSIGHPPIDATRLGNADALVDLIANSSSVLGVLTGHVHTPHSSIFAGVPLIGAPGIVSTLRINDPTRISADGAAPPGFAVHIVNGGRLSTRFVALAPG
jgi:3',5'-cyclic AMP phosphodiesterase CpdA